MWTWEQATGRLLYNGALVSTGYSGKGRGKNNPALQSVVGVGPIPRGRWRMTGVYNSKNIGPYAIIVDAVDNRPGDDRHGETGRSAFRIHGDSIRAPGTASRGCIILPRAIREKMWRSGVKELEIV